MSQPEIERGMPVAAAAGATAPARAPGSAIDVVFDHLRRLVRADAALLLEVDRDRTRIEPLGSWYSVPALGEALEPITSRPYDLERPGLTEATLERGRPMLLPRLEDWEAAGDPNGVLARLAPSGTWELVRGASVITCPVRSPLGRPHGVLIVMSLDPARPLGRTELDVVTVLADLAGLVRERSQLLAAEAARTREEALLKRAAERTAGTLDPSAVEREIVAHALDIAAADHGQLTRLQPGSERLVPVASSGGPSVEAGLVREVVRTRAPYLREAPDASLHVPLQLGQRLFGVLSLARVSGPSFDDDDLALVTKLARIAAAALANAHDFQHERHVARTLAHGFVPEPLPRIQGWQLGVLYEPAQHQMTGGDLYGAWPLASGEVAVLIGDVAGKGVETSALSSMVRFFVEARSWDADDPGAVLEQANTLLRDRLPGDRFVTAFFGCVGTHSLRYANAGHLTPMILRTDGTISETSADGLPLGVEERASYETGELPLVQGDVLFAFTDGIVEARRDGELLGGDGLRRILQEASAITREPQALAQGVHERVRAWATGLSDDAAIVALRRHGGLTLVGER